MNDCIVIMGKRGLYDNAALAVNFADTLTDVVFVDESGICRGSGIKGYIFASRYCPRLSGLFLRKFVKKYKIRDKKQKEFKESRIKLPVSAHKKCENVLYRFYPKAVVCLTPRTLALTLSAAETTGYKGCVIAGVYDAAPSPGMCVRGADIYLTGSRACAAALEKRGIKKERIAVTGMPVHASAETKERAMKQLGIKTGKPVVLIMGGRYCSGRAMDAARAFSAFSDRMQIVLSGGVRGAARVEKHCPSVIVAGEESVDMLYAAADVAVIAPTAFISAECLKNAIPTVLLPPVNRAQKAAYKALSDCCAAANDNTDAVNIVMDILMDKTVQDGMRARGIQYVEEGGEERLKAALLDVLERYRDTDVFAGASLPESDDVRAEEEENRVRAEEDLQDGAPSNQSADGAESAENSESAENAENADGAEKGESAQSIEDRKEEGADGKKRRFRLFGKK